MNHLPGTDACQGNFAASVKEILPMYECGALSIVASSGQNSPRLPKIRDISH